MIKLKIINIDGYIYNLKDTKENNYTLNLEFFDIDKKPQIGDYIYMSSELLNPRYEGFSTNYTFGTLEDRYGKKDIDLTDIDIIKVVINNLEIYLKRLYG